MASLNKVTLIGNLGADPETRYAPSGDAICNLRVATTEAWKDKATGERRENTEWHRVVFFGRLAEVCSEYLRKGSQIYLEGRLQTRKWQDKDGQDRYTTEIRGDEMKMLGGRPDGGNAPARQDGGGGESRQQQRPAQRPSSSAQGGGFDNFDDDIPFDRLGRGLAGFAV